ncbi:UNVERIFIED_CONTAM: hypothetical protein PYX00_011257 [Menopon gallinae]|uniref:Tubulin gamma chain n=1 Tax=Menopon gallinae TaxID=328185 RepID=A0AAW2H751_9NEOP
MREIIALQVGQCGNQIGNEFWSRICKEHNISSDGYSGNDDLDDRKDIFFYQADNNRYVPRAVLADLEPRVINAVHNGFYNEENIFLSNDGCGAGNNWAHGYCTGQTMKDEIVDALQREVEGCDLLESFLLFHSVAGGTGSGLGSLLLEEIRSLFPKKIIQSYSIFPNNTEISDVVVQPYNSVLSLQRLHQCCDAVVVMDNGALGKIALDTLRIKTPNYNQINLLISTVISASTNTIRFPTYMFSDMSSIVSATVPYNNLKFLVSSYSPFINKENRIVRKCTVDEILRRLYSDKTRMAYCDVSRAYSYISIFNVLNNVENIVDAQKALLKNFNISFVPWMPPLSHTVIGRNLKGRVCGLSLGNYTGISTLFRKICDQYDVLRQRNAYIENYRKFCSDLGIFDEARECVQHLIEEYQSSELSSFKNK